MIKQRFIIGLGLILFIAVSICRSEDEKQVTSKESVQTVNSIGEKKGQDTRKPGMTRDGGEPSSTNVCGDGPTDVSIIQLISNQEKYDGKYVRLVGFVRVAFESTAIYLHEDDFKYGLTRNGLWLNLTEDYFSQAAKFDRRYVLVEGVFSASDGGHMGLYSGGIRNIKRFEVWPVAGGKVYPKDVGPKKAR